MDNLDFKEATEEIEIAASWLRQTGAPKVSYPVRASWRFLPGVERQGRQPLQRSLQGRQAGKPCCPCWQLSSLQPCLLTCPAVVTAKWA